MNQNINQAKKLLKEILQDNFWTIDSLRYWLQKWKNCFVKEGKILHSSSVQSEDPKRQEEFLVEVFENFDKSMHEAPKDLGEKQTYLDELKEWRTSRELKKYEEELSPIMQYVLAGKYIPVEVIRSDSPKVTKTSNNIVCFDFESNQNEIVAIKFTGLKNECDAIFIMSNGSEQKVEVTVVGVGHQQALEAEMLNSKGVVWSNQELQVPSNKNAGREIQYSYSNPIAQRVPDLLELWMKGYHKKNEKSKYQDHWLFVVYNNISPEHDCTISENVNEFLKKIEQDKAKNLFKKIIFVRLGVHVCDDLFRSELLE